VYNNVLLAHLALKMYVDLNALQVLILILNMLFVFCVMLTVYHALAQKLPNVLLVKIISSLILLQELVLHLQS
jgi:hypothetical protein